MCVLEFFLSCKHIYVIFLPKFIFLLFIEPDTGDLSVSDAAVAPGLIVFVVFVGETSWLSQQLQYYRRMVEKVLNVQSNSERHTIQCIKVTKGILKNLFRIRSKNIPI